MQKPVIIDVRDQTEYAASHVEGAINIPPDELLAGSPQLADIPKDAPIILYRVNGSQSNTARRIMQQLGYTHVINGINKFQVEARLKALYRAE